MNVESQAKKNSNEIGQMLKYIKEKNQTTKDLKIILQGRYSI